MTVFKVKSSNILQIEHIDTSLIVYFEGGGIYQYKDVPESIATDMANAESAGRFLNKNVKVKYQFAKITEAEVISFRNLEKVVFYQVALVHDPSYYIITPYSGLIEMFDEASRATIKATLKLTRGSDTPVIGRLVKAPLPSMCSIKKIKMTSLEFKQLVDHKQW